MNAVSLCLAVYQQYKPEWLTEESIMFQYRILQNQQSLEWIEGYFRKLAKNIIIFNNRKMDLKRETARFIREVGDNFKKWYFVTVGYDDENITVDKMRSLSKKLSEKDCFREIRYVNEKFRRGENGEIYIHHHIHLLFESDLPKSKIIDRVFETVNKSVKSKNFVDVKGYKDKDLKGRTYESCLKYISGDKISSKKECLDLDKIWRSENNL